MDHQAQAPHNLNSSGQQRAIVEGQRSRYACNLKPIMEIRLRTRSFAAAAIVTALAVAAPNTRAQQKPSTADTYAAPKGFDPAAIRRQAAQRAELRSLLNDSDADVRLFTMREAIRNGDDVQRSTAIEAALASNETAMVEQALRGMIHDSPSIIIEFLDKDGKPFTQGQYINLRIEIKSVDYGSGLVKGTVPGKTGEIMGQVQGTVFSFQNTAAGYSGVLTWSMETGDLRGKVNLSGSSADGLVNALWKPR